MTVLNKYITNVLFLGLFLFASCEDKIEKKEKIFLHTLDSMKEATKIYEKEGFHRFEDIDFRNYGFEVKGYCTSL